MKMATIRGELINNIKGLKNKYSIDIRAVLLNDEDYTIVDEIKELLVTAIVDDIMVKEKGIYNNNYNELINLNSYRFSIIR